MILIKAIYSIIINIRNFLYDKKFLTSYKSSIPVVSVGNITVGGTGKTPFVIYLANYFNNLGYNPLIITRGYKRESIGQVFITKEHQYSTDYIGDEPFLISSLCSNVDIIINKNRVDAIKWAEKQNKKYDLIILDDGFQHRSVYRDFNILLINSFQKMHSYPPCGDLREPLKNIKRADYILYTKGDPDNTLKPIIQSFKLPTDQTDISFTLKKLDPGQDKNVLRDALFMQPIKTKGEPGNNLEKYPILEGISFCGIGSPEHFIETLEKMNILSRQHITLKDHQKYSKEILKKIETALEKNNQKKFFTTRKDWIKLPEEFLFLMKRKGYSGFCIDINIAVSKELKFWPNLERSINPHKCMDINA